MSTGSPRTVLYVVDGLGLSGKTRSLVSVATALDRRRFAPVVCRLAAESSPLVSALEAADVPLHTIPCRNGVNPGAALRLASLARALRADLVHCYNPRPMLYGGIAARAIGIRGTVASLSAFACQMPDRGYGFLPQPLATGSRRNVYRNRLAASTMRVVVAVSPSLGRRFFAYNGLPLEKLRVVPYAVDLGVVDRVTPEQVSQLRHRYGCRAGDLVIGSVGRLVEQKDYPTQLHAFALAAARVPNLRMVIAGDGPLRSILVDLARELSIADRVAFLGHRDDVPAVLRSLDVFVLASKFEPFGVALLEAKAAGLPIVATSVNEVPDIVADGKSGLLVPPQNAPTMAVAFLRLAAEPDYRRRLGERARLDVEQHSLAAAVAAHESLYDEALAHRPPESSGRSVPARPSA